jgi:putative membrane protein
MHYLGTQDDVWDGHRDMALASLGALAAMAVTAAVNLVLQRDFAGEWHESLRVKREDPLGEEAVMDNAAPAPASAASRLSAAGCTVFLGRCKNCRPSASPSLGATPAPPAAPPHTRC